MKQHIEIEDVVIPLRTYAWAITGSVNIADQLIMTCLEGVANAPAEVLPTTKLEWFGHIDNVVVDWVSSEHQEKTLERNMIASTINVTTHIKTGILYHLLERSIGRAREGGQVLVV